MDHFKIYLNKYYIYVLLGPMAYYWKMSKFEACSMDVLTKKKVVNLLQK